MSNCGATDNLINFTSVGENLYEADGKRKKRIFFRTLIIGICVIVLLFAETLFLTFYMGIYIVDGSMTPTLTGAALNAKREPLSGGDYIYINKYAKPTYGDIVVVYRSVSSVTGPQTDKIIKRAVAFGGDTVELIEGVLYVNDIEVKESYLSSNLNLPAKPNNTYSKHTVKEGCMFLLGDNRNESIDSRTYGDFPLSDLVGVVPEWSMRTKSVSSALYNYFHYTIFGK